MTSHREQEIIENPVKNVETNAVSSTPLTAELTPMSNFQIQDCQKDCTPSIDKTKDQEYSSDLSHSHGFSDCDYSDNEDHNEK